MYERGCTTVVYVFYTIPYVCARTHKRVMCASVRKTRRGCGGFGVVWCGVVGDGVEEGCEVWCGVGVAGVAWY